MTIQCYNCKGETMVTAPDYRCKICNYPLKNYLPTEPEKPKSKIVIDIEHEDSASAGTLHELLIKNKGGGEKPQEVKDKQVPSKSESADSGKSGNHINIDINSAPQQPVVKEQSAKREPDFAKVDRLNEILTEKPQKLAPSSPSRIVMKENKNPEKADKVIAGWLVTHTEERDHVTYNLYLGDNIMGRPDGPHHIDIKIEKDPYVSRIHSRIRVTKDYLHRFRFELIDDGLERGGVPSTNGTYINGNSLRIPGDRGVFLKNGDTVQVGETKLVFKSVDEYEDFQSAAISVQGTDFTQTIHIK